MVRNQLAEIDTNVFEDSLENIENKENNTSNRTFVKDNSLKSIFYEIPNTPQKHRSKVSNRLKNEIRKSLNSTVTLRKTIDNVNTTYVKDDKHEKIKNKKKICDVVYLKTIDNLLKSVNFELDFGKNNDKFKDDFKYIEIFQENVNKLNFHLKAKLRFNAGLKIVRWYRNILETKKAKKVLFDLKRNKSASIIQRNWKNYLATKSLRKVNLNKKNDAALIIQRNFRIHCTKKRLTDIKFKKLNDETLKKDQSAILIQRSWKRYKLKQHLAKMILKKQKLLENNSALIIQRFFRKIIFVKLLNRHILLNNSAKVIQKNWRIYLCKKKLANLIKINNYFSRKKSALIIQKNFRSYFLRKKLNFLINQRKRNEAALKIQKAWLRFTFVNNLETKIKEKNILKNESALIIQRNWKSYLIRKHLDFLIKKRKRNEASIKIQKAWIRFSLIKNLEKKIEKKNILKNRSALIIQKNWKNYIEKKNLENIKLNEFIKRQNKSAIIIQRNWKNYLTKKEIEKQNLINEFNKRLNACIRIQRFWRNYKLTKRIKAAILIQKTWRGYITRYNYMKDNKDVSVILERINEVNKNAQTQATVGEQTKNAIQKLLTYKYHGTALHFLKELEKTTNLSDESCLQMMDYQIIEILLKVVSECNRSDPCLEIIKLVYSVIMNIAKHEKALPLLSSMKQLKESIIDTLIKHHKKTSIFLKCMTLLYILLKHENFPESPAITVKIKRLLSKISTNYKYSNKNQKKVYEFDARWCSKKYARIQFYTTKQAIDAFHFIYL